MYLLDPGVVVLSMDFISFSPNVGLCCLAVLNDVVTEVHRSTAHTYKGRSIQNLLVKPLDRTFQRTTDPYFVFFICQFLLFPESCFIIPQLPLLISLRGFGGLLFEAFLINLFLPLPGCLLGLGMAFVEAPLINSLLPLLAS